MELIFEHEQKIGTGRNPAGYHSPDNRLQVICSIAGRIHGTVTETPHGDFESRTFSTAQLVAADTAAQFIRITYLPRLNVWLSWEDNRRHRLAMMLLKQDAAIYLINGSISYKKDDAIATLRLDLENPDHHLVAEAWAGIAPGTRAALFYSMGDSTRIWIGTFFIDRIGMSTDSQAIDVDARNTTGKLLKDQTLDEHTTYLSWTTADFFGRMLDDARVPHYEIEPATFPMVFTWPREKSYYDAITEAMQILPGWRLRENPDGKVVIGSPTFGQFTEGLFSFRRNYDCYSRAVLRDDVAAYSRLAVWYKEKVFTVTSGNFYDFEYLGQIPYGGPHVLHANTNHSPVDDGSETVTVDGQPLTRDQHYTITYATGAISTLAPFFGGFYYISYSTGGARREETTIDRHTYRDVVFLPGWNMPRKKTLYVELPENTTPTHAAQVADELAARLSKVGIVETFITFFTPHLQPGDTASITEPGKLARLIGTVTHVEQRFGRNGFYTEFTVDSGGTIGRPMIVDYIELITRRATQPTGSMRQLS